MLRFPVLSVHFTVNAKRNRAPAQHCQVPATTGNKVAGVAETIGCKEMHQQKFNSTNSSQHFGDRRRCVADNLTENGTAKLDHYPPKTHTQQNHQNKL